MGEGCNGGKKLGGLRGPRRLGHFGAGVNCRCPRGDQCGKGYKLLYKKQTRDECAEAGAWHLNDKEKHEDPPTWAQCLEDAEAGISESTRTIYVFLDADGVERQPPSIEKGDKGKKGNGKGHNNKGGDRDRGRRHRSRSRSPARDRDNQVALRHSVQGSLQGPIGGAPLALSSPTGTGHVTITRSELVMVVDSLQRAIASCDHAAVFCANAERHFRAESSAIEASKRAAERFLRL